MVSLDDQMPQQSALGLDMPPHAFKGQRMAPCEEGYATAIELRDGKKSCWVKMEISAAKCKEKGYEWKGGCYWPVIPLPREPSSPAPRVPPSRASHEQ